MNTTTTDSTSDCFHCGLPLPKNAHWPVIIDHLAHPMCCPGCQAVAQTIVDQGLADYYHTRTAFSVTANNMPLVALELHDALEATVPSSANACEATFSIDELRCAACVWLIEKRVSRVHGVQNAHINVATECLHVKWTKDHCTPADILQALHKIGYTAYPFDTIQHSEQLRRSGKTLFCRLFVAGLSMMQVMMYAFPAYWGADTVEADMAQLLRWASLILTLPAIFYAAQPFFKSAWNNLKHRAIGMDVPVALGIAAASIGSTIATVRGQGDVYFDSITMFIFLLLCSRYLELMARRNAAGALEKLHHARPASASRLLAYPGNQETEIVPPSHLAIDDFILVKPGEAIAADGAIVEGDTALDLSLLTGESQPVRKIAGDTVPGGAINATQAIVVRVTKAAHESTLSTLIRLIEQAGQAKPRLVLWADQVAAWFVAALLVFAVMVFAVWQWHDPTRAWPIAIAVLVVSCPCALSLATPTALAAATDRLLRQRILLTQPHVLETLHRATHILFDKTGTLTVGKPVLYDVTIFGAMQRAQCLEIAAALEAKNAHPLGTAIVAATPLNNMHAHDVRYVAGQGLEGNVNGMPYRLGNASFVEEWTGHLSEAINDDLTSIHLGTYGRWLARFDLTDAIRNDAQQVIAYFQKRGKKVILLSGDHANVTQRVATQLGIDTAHGGYLPDQKLAFVQHLQCEGAIVAMIGDGINDAAVLKAADVSFAMGNGATLAQVHADAVLLSNRLASLQETAQVATQTLSIIRQNLAWATLYNLLAIPAAAFGWLNPWLSGIGMASSSAIVVLNALRLRRIRST